MVGLHETWQIVMAVLLNTMLRSPQVLWLLLSYDSVDVWWKKLPSQQWQQLHLVCCNEDVTSGGAIHPARSTRGGDLQAYICLLLA